jgi:hypothetical protein
MILHDRSNVVHGKVDNCQFEAVISRHDKATLTGLWMVPDWLGPVPPQWVFDTVRALGPDDAFLLVGNNKASVDEAARCLRSPL